MAVVLTGEDWKQGVLATSHTSGGGRGNRNDREPERVARSLAQVGPCESRRLHGCAERQECARGGAARQLDSGVAIHGEMRRERDACETSGAGETQLAAHEQHAKETHAVIHEKIPIDDERSLAGAAREMQ